METKKDKKDKKVWIFDYKELERRNNLKRLGGNSGKRKRRRKAIKSN